MTLQQLRYLIAIASYGSISAAAHKLYVSQSSLSVAVKDVERETGVTIFERSNRGISLTNEGVELLGYARQVVEQADRMDQRYAREQETAAQSLAISSQHYSCCVETFQEFIKDYSGENYRFSLKETNAAEIIEDVQNFRSDLGVLFLSNFNRRELERAFEDANLHFESIFSAQPHIFVRTNHPLAKRAEVELDELKAYPRISFDTGLGHSVFYAEEPFAELPHSKSITVSDRASLANLLAHTDAFTISTGMMSSEMFRGMQSIALKTDETMEVGYLTHNERQLSALAAQYIEKLKLFTESYHMVYAML